MMIIIGILMICILIYIIVFPYPKTTREKEIYDCAIVLGYPANADGTISKILKSRIDAGIELYQKGIVKKIILTGGSVQNEYNEAKTMYEYALQLGLSQDIFILETKARSTYHNLLYCKDIMEEYHFNDCLVVTNSWHLRKGNYYTKKQKLNYAMYCAAQPLSYSKYKIVYMHLYMHITTFIQLLKGYH